MMVISCLKPFDLADLDYMGQLPASAAILKGQYKLSSQHLHSQYDLSSTCAS